MAKLLIISLFSGLFVLNLYFRYKVLKAYKFLLKHDIKISIIHIFNKNRLENEVIQEYAVHRAGIENFVNLIRRSLVLSAVVVITILIVGTLLINFI